jgi:hypothetical protein
MNLQDSLSADDESGEITWQEMRAQREADDARSRKATDAKWARRRAEAMFDFHGGLIPWHETEADKKAEISAQQNQDMYPKIFQLPLIGGKRTALDGMMEAFTLSQVDKSNSRERN